MGPIRWNAEDYARHSSLQREWALELIAKLSLQGLERVLDIGCGDGKVTAEIADHLPSGSAVGIDSSADMIDLASRRFPQANRPNLRFLRADARDLPFEEEFDVVFSNAALHWILDHRPVLAGIRRALRTKGSVLLQMGGRGNAAGVVAAADRLRSAAAWAPFFEGFAFPYGFHGPEEYAVWLREAGLRPRRVELLPKEALHADRAAFEGWLRTTWLPYTLRVPEDRRTEFVAALADEYLVEFPADGEGRCQVRMVRLEVDAERV